MRIMTENKGGVKGVKGATIQWELGKGIPIKVEHVKPSKQTLDKIL